MVDSFDVDGAGFPVIAAPLERGPSGGAAETGLQANVPAKVQEPPASLAPVRQDAVRAAARGIEVDLAGLAQDQRDAFSVEVRRQQLDDLVDLLDDRGGVRLRAPRRHVKQLVDSLALDEVRLVASRLKSRGRDDAVEKLLKRVPEDRRPEHVEVLAIEEASTQLQVPGMNLAETAAMLAEVVRSMPQPQVHVDVAAPPAVPVPEVHVTMPPLHMERRLVNRVVHRDAQGRLQEIRDEELDVGQS